MTDDMTISTPSFREGWHDTHIDAIQNVEAEHYQAREEE